MTKSHFKQGALTVFLAAMAALAKADEPPRPLKMADLPPELRSSIREQIGKGRVGEIERNTEGGETTYDVEIRKNGRLRNITFDEGGALLEQEVFAGETPPPVQAAIKKLTGSAEIEEIDKQFEDGTVSYQVDLTNDDHERTFTLDEGGKLLELQVFPAEIPPVVYAAMKKATGCQSIGDIIKNFEDGEITYDAEFNSAGKSRTVSFDPSGAIVSEETEVQASETPAAVQQAIAELAKSGKVGTITKSVEDGDTAFDVDVRRGGKWQAISLGSDGVAEP